MKKIITIFLIGFISFSSCKDVLNKVPLDIISDASLWNDTKLIDSYLSQTYYETTILVNESGPIDIFGAKGDVIIGPFGNNQISDEAGYGTWWAAGEGWSFKFGNLTETGGVFEWWESAYRIIRELNLFIQKVSVATVTDDFKKQRIAEAKFLRAYNYFALVKRYGGVPLITVAQDVNASEEELYPKRATEQVVYDFILSEIDNLYNDLPAVNSASDYGRPTKYAALVLKCRAALYAGSIAKFGTVQLGGVVGINPAQANSYYQQSYDAAKLIINSGLYQLYNQDANKEMNFRNIFLVKNNKEVIFVKRHNSQDAYAGGNGWSYDFCQTPGPNTWGVGNIDAPYLEMAEEFEHIDGTSGKLDRTAIQQGLWTYDELWANKDPRFFATIYTNGTPWNGTPVDFHKGIVKPDGTIQIADSYQNILAIGKNIYGPTTFFGVKKYLVESKDVVKDPFASSETDWIVFRYGEVLLNIAEAAFELGKSGEALDAVNQIRNRAGIEPLGTIDRNKIHHERKVELAFEGHRYWDARRWRTAVTDLSRTYSGLQYILDFNTRKYKLVVVDNIDGGIPAFFQRHYYLPITPNRTGNNKNLVENPGY